MLHKWKDFARIDECDRAFEELKKYLAHPQSYLNYKKKEVMYAYVAITAHAMSLVLVRTKEG